MIHHHKYSYSFPKNDAVTFKQLTFSMLQLQADLALHYATVAGMKMFTITQKSYSQAHLAFTCDTLNQQLRGAIKEKITCMS